jgi:hypothetical protein
MHTWLTTGTWCNCPGPLENRKTQREKTLAIAAQLQPLCPNPLDQNPPTPPLVCPIPVIATLSTDPFHQPRHNQSPGSDLHTTNSKHLTSTTSTTFDTT